MIPAGIFRDGRVVGEHVQPTVDAGHVLVEDEQLRTVQTVQQSGHAVVVRRLRAETTGLHGKLSGRLAAGGRPARSARRAGISQGIAGIAELHRSRRPVLRPGETTLPAAVHVVDATTTTTATAATTAAAATVAATTTAAGQRRRTR